MKITRIGVSDGNDSIVVIRDLSDLSGGRTLDMSGWTGKDVHAGHIIIKKANGDYAPLGVDSMAYVDLSTGEEYAGVLKKSVTKKDPRAAIMTRGIVNYKALPYEIDDTIAAGLNDILFAGYVPGEEPGPTPPTPTADYLYFEAAEANSTVSLMSMLPTAPNLEYSTDGETWQEWQHTTADGTHTFDTLTLTAVGDRVYFRGENNDISDIANNQMTMFDGSGKMNSGGNITSLFNKTGEDSEIGGAAALFANMYGTSDFLLSAPTLNMTGFTNIASLLMLFFGQTYLTTPAYMPNITFDDVFPGTSDIHAEETQMFGMYVLTQVRLISEDYMSIPSMPSFSLGNTVYFYTDSDPAYPTVMDAENVALCLSARINTVEVKGRESVSGGYFFIDGGLNAGTKSSISIRDGRTVTFVAVPQSGYHIVKWIKAEPLWAGTANIDIPDSATLTLAYNLPVKEGDTLYEAAIQPVFEQD